MLFCFGGCSDAGNNKDDETKRVAYISRAPSDKFGDLLTNTVKDEAKKDSNISLDVFDGEGDIEKQIEFIEKTIKDKYDCIIIHPQDGVTLKPHVQKIQDAGIITITTNPRIDGIEGASTVDVNSYEQAKVNCDLAVELVPQNAKVVVLKGPKDNFHSEERRSAWQTEFFDKRPDVTIVWEEHADWMQDNAKTLMQGWTASGDTIDAVISMNDDMCVGAIEAIDGNSKYENMLAFGVDGTEGALALIKEGKMTSTCMQDAHELAGLIIETANKLLSGEEKELHTKIGTSLVTKDNVDEYIAGE